MDFWRGPRASRALFPRTSTLLPVLVLVWVLFHELLDALVLGILLRPVPLDLLAAARADLLVAVRSATPEVLDDLQVADDDPLLAVEALPKEFGLRGGGFDFPALLQLREPLRQLSVLFGARPALVGLLLGVKNGLDQGHGHGSAFLRTCGRKRPGHNIPSQNPYPEYLGGIALRGPERPV